MPSPLPGLPDEAGFDIGELWTMGLIAWLIVGGIAGWLAGLLVKGAGFGIIGNIVVGIVGALLAGWLLPQLGISLGAGLVAEIIDATIGAVVLLLIVLLVTRR